MNSGKHGNLKVIFGIIIFIIIGVVVLSLSNMGNDKNKAADTNTAEMKAPKKAVAHDTVSNTSGNTSGNLNNTGRFTIQGDWIYYTHDENIYKIKSDGSDKTNLASQIQNCGNINVVGNYLYYVSFDGGDLIYKMATDGSQRAEVLSSDNDSNVQYAYLIVVGNWIYYEEYRDGKSSFNKMKTDGSQKTVLLEDTNVEVVDGEWIYYTKNYEGYARGALYKMRTDGSENTKLTDLEDANFKLDVSDGWIYYINGIQGGNTIYKVKTDGSQKTKVASKQKKQYNNQYNYINVVGDWIYYSDIDCNKASSSQIVGVSTISKMKTDGSENTKLIDKVTATNSYEPISVVGDWIYYDDEYDEQHSKWLLHRIKTDGSQQTQVQ
jgi:uncharacterized protein YihD (DUF1040 family)